MKYLKVILSVIFINTLIACGSGPNDSQDADTADSTSVDSEAMDDYSDMREVDLSEYGIMASIMVPKENRGKLEIEETSWGSISIQVGEKFGIEIVPFGLSLAEVKAELDQGGVYEVEIVEESEQSILYRKTIPNAEVKDEFHCFMNVELNGEVYELKSLAEMELKEAHARRILKSAKSFQSKEAV